MVYIYIYIYIYIHTCIFVSKTMIWVDQDMDCIPQQKRSSFWAYSIDKLMFPIAHQTDIVNDAGFIVSVFTCLYHVFTMNRHEITI